MEFVGFGKIARDQHAPAIAASPDFELAAVSNVGSGASPRGVSTFATPAEMLERTPDLDAIAICTPCRAAAAKKVVFATYHAQHNAAVKKAAESLANKTIKTVQPDPSL